MAGVSYTVPACEERGGAKAGQSERTHTMGISNVSLRVGDLNDALRTATAAITARSQQLGAEHESTLWSIAMVVSTYRSQGRWKEAEELEVKVMETRVRVLGGEHPDTLNSMANLAATYWNQGRWKEAEDLISEAAEASGRVLGKTHPDTLARTSAFHRIGRHDDSQPVKKCCDATEE
ncbi:hypothetical protein LTR01_008923 [Friedmanniomyces endolithicus]|nr:hypothetical protein LTR01_008923 [Friedmanniomyces endolithicus]KAK0822873.1 hypothetical protein LTR73_008961 [Friedmanniomyces endolithicus]